MNFSRESKLETAENNINNIESLLDNFLEDHHTTLDIDEHNKELNKTIPELEELSQPPYDLLSSDTTDEAFTIVTKNRTRYLNSIR